MILIDRSGETIARLCDVTGCPNSSLVTKWPSGSVDGGGMVGAMGPRQGRTRTRYDVCPGCVAAGRLPPLAENPQPFPMQLV